MTQARARRTLQAETLLAEVRAALRLEGLDGLEGFEAGGVLDRVKVKLVDRKELTRQLHCRGKVRQRQAHASPVPERGGLGV